MHVIIPFRQSERRDPANFQVEGPTPDRNAADYQKLALTVNTDEPVRCLCGLCVSIPGWHGHGLAWSMSAWQTFPMATKTWPWHPGADPHAER